MSRNDSRSTTRVLRRDRRRSLGLWLAIALIAGTCCSRLAGQNSSLDFEDFPEPNRSSQPARKMAIPNLDRFRMPRRSSATVPTIGSTRSQRPASPTSNSSRRDNAVRPTSHEDFSESEQGSFGLSPDVPLDNAAPSSLPPLISRARPMAQGPSLVFPAERKAPPQITGTHLGLHSGETATERSMRLMNVIAELEEQNANLAEQNAKLNAELKAKEAKLQTGTQQISATRKELSLAQDEFRRMRKEIAELREKFRTSERESAALMRSLSPLLKQMLQSDDDLPTKD